MTSSNVAVGTSTQQATQRGPTPGRMAAIWAPLAVSMLMMVVEPTIISMGLGRTSDPELALGAYGVAYSLALLIEAPVLMLIDASVARSASERAFVVIREFTLLVGLAVVAIGLLLALTPLYGILVLDLMRIPADVAARARPTLQLLAIWPLPIAWRRAHQGALIRAGRTTVITTATGVRLLALAGTLFGGLVLWPEASAVVVGLAMNLSVFVEAILVTVATRAILRDGSLKQAPGATDDEPLSLRGLWHFYRPLVATSLFRQSVQPVLSAGIAAATMARASLAAWPVAWGLVTIITGPAWSLQQLSAALSSDRPSYRQVARFSLGLSSVLALLLAAIAFTPLYRLAMGGVYNLSDELQALARPAVRLLTLLPLLQGGQALLRGALIRGGCTAQVRTAMMLDVAALVLTVLVGVHLLSPTGVVLAAAATLLGGGLEVAWLYRHMRC